MKYKNVWLLILLIIALGAILLFGYSWLIDVFT